MSLVVACVRIRAKSERVEEGEREGCRIVNQAEDVQSSGVNENCGSEEV